MINLIVNILLRIKIKSLIVNQKQGQALERFHTEIVFIFLEDILEKEELILMTYSNIRFQKNNGMN
jgi:hypothetical protein